MTELERKALLPAGLRDVLPPFAAFEAEVVERLMARFAASARSAAERGPSPSARAPTTPTWLR